MYIMVSYIAPSKGRFAIVENENRCCNRYLEGLDIRSDAVCTGCNAVENRCNKRKTDAMRSKTDAINEKRMQRDRKQMQ